MEAATEGLKPVTDATFAAEVLQSDKPVVVDFWAEWCVPCRKVHTLFNELAGTELGTRVRFVKVDIDANPEISRTYQVMSVPTITIFKNGEPVQSVSGARPKGQLVRMIEDAL